MAAGFSAVLGYCNRVIQSAHKGSVAEKKLDFRELIVDSSNEVQRMLQAAEVSPLNKWQCEHLQQTLKGVKEVLDHQSFVESGDGSASNSGSPLKELYRFVKEAEDLVRQCCAQPWMRAAIAQADNGEAFCEVIYDLEWCMMASRQIKSAASAGNPKRQRGTSKFKVQLAKRLAEIREVNADAAHKDREELEARLKGEIQKLGSEQLGQENLTLATYLLSRLTDAKASKGVYGERKRIEGFNRGSFGLVYKILWLGEIYAEKVFDLEKEEASARENLRKSFQREGHALLSLRHRNVVQLIDHFSNDKECSLVMEYMSGNDLRKHINKQFSPTSTSKGIRPPFSLAVAVDILVQIAKGMQYMHGKRMAHRDIKARNVLVSLVNHSASLEAEGYVNVKLGDLGMAKREPGSSKSSFNMTTLGGAVGTYLWKAPELLQARNSDELSAVDPFAADVYSYGITCSEVMTGHIPFSTDGDVPLEDEAFVARIAEGYRPELPIRDDVCPPALEFLISKCWSTDPANRPSAADIVRYLHDFKASLLAQAEFDHLSWTWNFDPGSIDEDDLSSSDDEILHTVREVQPAGKEPGGKFPVSKLFVRAKDWVSWLIPSSTPSPPIGPSIVEIPSAEITSEDLESMQFPLQKLQAATNNFDDDWDNGFYKGKGPFARIFRGLFTGKLKEAAVRELVFARNSDRTKFLENVSVMATIKHPNLINLVGYCENEGHFYLVHEFYDSPGTIGTVLLGFSKPADHPKRNVSWSERCQIGVRVGQALAYLHDRDIIHGYLTTRSIMLEEPDLNPRLFDFGMASLFPDLKDRPDDLGPQLPSLVIENHQWTAPEHKTTGRRNDIKPKAPESDMYSFGILMLVLVSGRKVTQEDVGGSIIDAACQIYNDGDVLEFLDPALPAGSVAPERMLLIMQVAMLCLQKDPQRRPKASEAVQMLKGEVAIAADRLLNITAEIQLSD